MDNNHHNWARVFKSENLFLICDCQTWKKYPKSSYGIDKKEESKIFNCPEKYPDILEQNCPNCRIEKEIKTVKKKRKKKLHINTNMREKSKEESYSSLISPNALSSKEATPKSTKKKV